MRYQASNLKDSLKALKLGLVIVLIGITLFSVLFLSFEIPKLFDKRFDDPLLQQIESGINGLIGPKFPNRNDKSFKMIISIALIFVISVVILLVLIVFFSKLLKDASKYDLTIDGSMLNIICEGQEHTLDVAKVNRFEILPKNFDPHNKKSKWSDVAFIESEGMKYYLYYLKDLSKVKEIFESNKRYAMKAN